MISTKNLISDLADVPRQWVFEYYLNLGEKLDGQNIKMLSAFNVSDKVPSMFIYYDLPSGYYKFKDFSSGFRGDGIELVQLLFKLPTRGHATNKIMHDYQQFMLTNTAYERTELKFYDKFKVTDYEIRHWTTQDATYWGSFKINSQTLAKYNVNAIKHFTMAKTEDNGEVTSFTFDKPYLYGYFKEDGELYKLYMPKNLDKKFIKVQNYIQGIEQLEFKSKYLVICSSLKDLMCFNRLSIGNVECIAPDSENTMIGELVMNKLIPKYSKVIVLFDNDGPGISAADRYKEKYGFNNVILDMSKDLSDSIKDHGIEAVRDRLLKQLKEIV